MPLTTQTEAALGGDAAASTATLLQVDVGGTVHGEIGTSGDHDFIAVDLVAGQTYTFAMVGIGDDILTDAVLSLRAADGITLLASNDDGLQNKNVIFQFTATTTGTHYLDAEAFGTKTGSYSISVTEGNKADFDAAMIAGAIDTHLRWSATRGTGTNLTYGFSDTFTSGYATFSQFTEAQKTVVRDILANVAELTGMTFTEVNPGGYTDEAVLLYGNYDADDGAGAWGGYPADTSFTSTSGNVWVNDATPPTEGIGPGSWFYSLMLHEIGHTMGLSHPGMYNAAVGVSITYAANAQFLQDSEEFSVMSYFNADETGASGLTPQSFGLYDILALQQIYGANMTTRTGDNTYGFGSDLGGIYDFASNTTPKLVIWDAGGHDRLDLSRYSSDQRIDLAPGGFSSTGGFTDNLAIAHGATIEDARGGRGADTISGNAADNLLQGEDSDDHLSGLSGNDTLQGGGGADSLFGGAGNDLLQGNPAGTVTAPEAFDLITTDYSAGAKLRLTGATLFPLSSFTIEMIWQQQDLADEHYSVDFGNLSFYRHANGRMSLNFWDATVDGWLYSVLPEALTDGDPHRLSITYDDTTGLLCIYLDGAETGNLLLTPGTRMLDATGTIAMDDDAAVGDLRIFDLARSAEEIWDNAWISLADPGTVPGLLHNWAGNATGQFVSRLDGQPGFQLIGSTGHLQTALWSQGTGDAMSGGAGDDLYEVRSSADTVIEAAGGGNDRVLAFADFTLGAGQEVEEIEAASGSGGLRLAGNAGANRLRSASDADDTLAGGAGDDVYHVNTANDRIEEAAGAGNDRLYASTAFALTAGTAVETLHVDTATGIALAGNELGNTFHSGVGTDTLTGGAGNDVFYLNTAEDQVLETAGGGSDTIYAGIAYALAAGVAVETLRVNSATGIALAGNELANTLHSGAGSDTLTGGVGNDTFYLNGAGDRVIELTSGGSDTIYASAGYALAAGVAVETLHVNSATGIALTGNELANTLHSGAGSDTLTGGAGNDTFYLNGAGDRVVELTSGGSDTVYASTGYALAAGVAVETLRVNSAAGIALAGNELANTFHSGAGSDTLTGGAGNDTFYLNGAGDRVVELTSGGSDTIYVSAGYTLAAGVAVETLRVNSATGIALAGNELANTLHSGAGNDTLTGGAGNDTFYLNGPGGRVIELTASGSDTIYASAGYTLAAGVAVETLRVNSAVGIALAGNELANTLHSGAGNDTLTGGAGNDTFYLNGGGDRVVELTSGGSDTIYTSVSYALGSSVAVETLRGRGTVGLSLTGNAAANSLYGTTGADSLRGGLGHDRLFGGIDTAVDRFVFASVSDSLVGSLRDRIHDFRAGTDDIDLQALDANSARSGNQAFLYATKATANAVWTVATGANLILRADVTGDAVADFELGLYALTSLSVGDLIL